MKTSITKQTNTHVTFNVQMDEAALKPIVDQTYDRLRANLKVAGFRPGKAPNSIVERELGAAAVQNEILEAATNHSYAGAIRQHDLPVIAQPELKLTKFVPYTELEYEATAEVLPPIKLADYKNLKVKQPEVKVEPAEIDQVVEDLRRRLAKRSDADRPAQNGDEAVIDFEGTKNNQPIAGAKASNYPLALGSGAFIPGFEDQVIGMKAGQSKEFDITFPKDYASTELANQKVTFKVKLNRVVAIELPPANDDFAKEVGGGKSLAQLRQDIEASLRQQKEQEASGQYDELILAELAKQSKLAVPQRLIDQQASRITHELETNLQQRGLTIEQYAAERGTTPQAIEAEVLPEAKRRVELALLLTEVAKTEKVSVSPAEIDGEIARLKSQYTDAEMQRELDRPETREEVYNHLMASRTIAKIRALNEGK